MALGFAGLRKQKFIGYDCFHRKGRYGEIRPGKNQSEPQDYLPYDNRAIFFIAQLNVNLVSRFYFHPALLKRLFFSNKMASGF